MKDSVMNAKIDLKVLLDLSVFKNLWMEQFTVQQPTSIGIIY